VLKACAAINAPKARKAGLAAADRMVGILYTGDMTTERALAGLRAARNRRAGVVEVVFHVGRADEAERPRWAGRDFLADFYCAASRDSEFDEAAKLARLLTMKDGSYEVPEGLL